VTTETLWIVVAVVAAVLLIALVLGLVLRQRRRISLRETEELEDGTRPDTAPPRRGGTYQAQSGFSFSSGTATAPKPAPPAPSAPTGTTTPTDGTAPAADRAAPADSAPAATPPAPAETAPAPAPPSETAPAEAPPAETAPATPVDTAPAETAPAAPAEPAAGAKPPVAPPAETSPAPTAADTAPPEAPPAGTAPARADTAPPEAPPVGTAPTPTHDGAAPEATRAGSAPAPATDAAPPAAPPADAAPAAPAPTLTPPVEAAPAPPAPAPAEAAPAPQAPTQPVPAAAAPTEDIAPAEGRMERLRGRLARSRSGFGQSLLGLLGAGELDEESWEDVEAMLLQADLGPDMTLELVDTLRTEMARRAVRTPAQARALLRDVLSAALEIDLDRSVRALPHDGRPAVLLVVGVNGTGKTTTTGKLARVLVAGGQHVVLGAADTFRAAAAEQLMTWGERAGATVVRGPEGADPASVAFDAVKQGAEEGADAVLLDTAGRLHTKTGLMDELGKVKRVVERQAEVDEVLLVLDATTGQNGLTQARVFGDVVKVTGIVLTKLDGTAKGGIVFRVQRELGVPVKLVGLGEGPDDLAPFEPAAFVDALLG
jgi:fused signal recognition particle receptor